MKVTLKHVLLLVAAPALTAFLDYLQNTPVLDSRSLMHALVASLLVALGILSKSPLLGASATLMVLGLASVTACGNAAPAKNVSTTTTQALARGALETAEHVWMDVAQACVDTGDATIMARCKDALLPGRDALVAAATALDTWSDASAGQVACAIADAVAGVQAVAPDLHPSAQESALIQDAAELAHALGCTKDAGAGQ